jgi:UDP-3-O-[3-hydroxymyristoyl] glucosamine N-acyltransferase
MGVATLGELAKEHALELAGDAATRIEGVCTLDPGKPGHLAFLANPRYKKLLAGTRAAAVVLAKKDAAGFTGNALIAKDPYLAYARIARGFDRSAAFTPGRHPSAVVATGVVVPASAHVGPHSVLEPGVVLGEGVFVGAGSVIGANSRIGEGTRIEARVVLCDRVRIGRRCRINPGAIIGGRGFGLARGPKGWEEVPQLGTVVIGDDVEIGSNTCIDRGAVDDTVIEDGAKLDNLIQIGHNVRIGKHTAMAGMAGVAGSTRVGANCMIGGNARLNGHIDVCDGALIAGGADVAHSITQPGVVYGNVLPAQDLKVWTRTRVRIQRLEQTEARLAAIERKLGIQRQTEGEGGESDSA